MSNVQERAKPHTALKVAFVAALAYGVIAGTPLRASLTDTQGQVYYVSAQTGSLGNDGTDPTHPFLTIAQCSAILQPGDTCSIGAGTYRETVTPGMSGTAARPITYTAAAGVAATVSGADPITRWTRVGATSVYTAPASVPISGTADSGFAANQLFVDGVMMPEARWPNVTSFDPLEGLNRAVATSATTTTITDTTLPAGAYTGALLHYWGFQAFSARTAAVTASASPVLTFTAPLAGCPNICAAAGTLYFLSGLAALLDSAGEWVYTPTTGLATPALGTGTVALWPPGGDSPRAHTVEMKQRLWAFDLSGKSHITVSGLDLFGASITTTASSSYDTLSALTVTDGSHYQTIPETVPFPTSHLPYFGHMADSGIVLAGTHLTLVSSVITGSAGNGVALQGSDNLITNTLIANTDYGGSYNAPVRIYAPTGPVTVTHSTLYGAGRDGVNLDWANTATLPAPITLSSLDIYGTGRLTQDTGGIYWCCGMNGAGSTWSHIWSHDLAVVPNGIAAIGAGLYLDNGSGNVALDHIVAWNNQRSGVLYNQVSAGGSTVVGAITTTNATLPGTGQQTDLEVANTVSTTLRASILALAPTLPTLSLSATNLISATPPYVDAAHHDYRLAAALPALQNVGAYPFEQPDDWVPGCSIRVSPLCQDAHTPTRFVP